MFWVTCLNRGAEAPFSPHGSATVPNTAHFKFCIVLSNHTAKTILFITQHHHIQYFANGGTCLNQKQTLLYAGLCTVSSTGRLE